jgi:hypothetical protein
MSAKSDALERLNAQIELSQDRIRKCRDGLLPGDVGPPRKDDTPAKVIAVENDLIAACKRGIAVWEKIDS